MITIGRDNRVIFDFLGYIRLIYNFVERNCLRHIILKIIDNNTNFKFKILKSVSTSKWTCKSQAVSFVKLHFSFNFD